MAFIIIAIFLLPGVASAQEKGGGLMLLQQGIEHYKVSDFQNSLIRFRGILSDPAAASYNGDAYFWIAKSNLALGRYEEAEKNLEHFLKTFPDNPFYAEGLYEKGRLLFLQGEFETSLQALQSFISAYPDSPYLANAYYWSGESLFSLGDLSSAERMFTIVVSRFPTSFRVEAARYRISTIELKYREEELLKLLKWSHEEYLKALEEFKKRETTYEEAVTAFQRKIAALTAQDLHGEIVKLTERVRVLEAELNQAKTTIQEKTSAPQENLENRLKAAAIKEEALLLKELYLDKLIKTAEGKP
jgi:TolA-binding protein